MVEWIQKAACVLVATLAIVSCSGSSAPSQPGPPAPPFASGIYELSFMTLDGGLGQGSSGEPCSSSPTGLWAVFTEVEMRLDGSTWRGRPRTPEGGSFELVLDQIPGVPGPPNLFAVTGNISGEAADARSPGLRITFEGASGGPASVSGTLLQIGSGTGTVSGEVVFRGGTEASAGCRPTRVYWLIRSGPGTPVSQ